MYYRLVLEKTPQSKTGNNLLMKALERGRITVNSGIKSISINPYLLRFFKKKFNRPQL